MPNINSLSFDDVLLAIVIILLIVLLVQKHRHTNLRNQPEGLGIGSLVEQVRTELYQAEERRLSNNEGKLFTVDKFDLEINFVIKSSDSTNAGIKIEPVTVGGQSEYSSEKIQKITLHMIAATPQHFKQPVEEEPIQGKDIIEHRDKPDDAKGEKP